MDDKIKNLIQNHIDENEVCLFMKGTPDAPECGFSMAVSNMLKILEVNFKGVNVLEDQSLREGIKIFSIIVHYCSFVLIARACNSFPIRPFRELYTILCCSILLFPEK